MGALPRATTDDVRTARRISLYRVTGYGKSTAATALASRLDLPLHLVDDEVCWLPGWIARSDAEQDAIASAILHGDAWLIDSFYGPWRSLARERAEVIVALDYSRMVTLVRLVRRTVRRARSREPICNGNVETWKRVLGPSSIIRWHFTSFARKRARMRAWEKASDGPKVYRVSTPRALRRLMQDLDRKVSPPSTTPSLHPPAGEGRST